MPPANDYRQNPGLTPGPQQPLGASYPPVPPTPTGLPMTDPSMLPTPAPYGPPITTPQYYPVAPNQPGTSTNPTNPTPYAQPQQLPPQPAYAGQQYPPAAPAPYPGGSQPPIYQQPVPPQAQSPAAPPYGQPANYSYANPEQLQPQAQPLGVVPSAVPEQRYDFFLNQPAKVKKPLLPGGSSPFAKIIYLAVAAFLVLGVLAIILSSLRGGSDTIPGLTKIVTEQQEIIRVSKLGTAQVTSPSLKNFSVTADTTLTSAQQDLIKLLAKNGVKIDPKVLAGTANPRIDEILDAARAASTYDTAYITTQEGLLSDYSKTLDTANAAATSAVEREIINKNIAAAELLQRMLSQ